FRVRADVCSLQRGKYLAAGDRALPAVSVGHGKPERLLSPSRLHKLRRAVPLSLTDEYGSPLTHGPRGAGDLSGLHYALPERPAVALRGVVRLSSDDLPAPGFRLRYPEVLR